ncbi:mechanosensitive ion channel family protein [Altericroceibacterium endophyticum]|uniref:Mechanosensitive ion channel n=1 Tax=Altericroceibacterium endophyticum TaxID=1808508 RepID=A0A6I4T9F0_9SPHN|nr:mechanosensitive ion channel family protein [Altericroceibacterium endophyticum]MXO66395.1 mechanosensitive ion channel [Altericroceibacterium endophyticum]
MKFLRQILCLLLLMVATAPAAAQLLTTPTPEASQAADPYGRETPRGTVTGLIDALAAQDYTRASNFFAFTKRETSAGLDKQADIARRMQAALDSGGKLEPFAALSSDDTGRVDDGLPEDQERVGTFGGNEDVPFLLSRTENDTGRKVWKISRKTIRELGKIAPSGDAVDSAGEQSGLVIGGAPLGDWLLLIGIAIGSFLLFWLSAYGIIAVLRMCIKDREKSTFFRLIYAALPPLSLFLSVLSFQFWTESLEVSIVARQTLLRYIGIVAWVALAWFALRLVDAVSRLTIARMERRERRQAASVVALARRGAKVMLLAMAVVAVLDTFGFDVTTGIAALGIGGIALALGAQKTVENLVGSVSVIADRPVQVGDFCRVGDVIGTVEDIGMRSTRVRTLDRSLVTIPNGDFSSREIENYAKRDRFLFAPVIGVEYGISADKLREGAEIIEQILRDHDQVETHGMRARFADFGASSLDIEVWAYITTFDYAESRFIRHDLMLSILEQLEAAGLSIAFPTRTVHLVQDKVPESSNNDDEL